MALPSIIISFKNAAETAVKRSGRGIVAVILDDIQASEEVQRYSRYADIPADKWSEHSIEYLKMIFEGGASGVIAVRLGENTEDAFNALTSLKWNWLVSPKDSMCENIVSYIKTQRAAGKTFKAVVANAVAPDSEGIVNFTASGIKVAAGSGMKSVSAAEYTLRIAGILAGLDMSKSATYYELSEVCEIDQPTDPDRDIDAGRLIIVYDGEKYKIGRAVTSLINTQGKSAEFKKIKAVEGTDMINDDIRMTFTDNYIGSVVNSYDNKQVLVSAINSYFSSLEGTVLDGSYLNRAEVDYDMQYKYLTEHGVDTNLLTDTQILAANTGSNVYLKLHMMLLDAVEDLTIEANLN